MTEREIHFYRCPGSMVGFDSVICDGELYRLDEELVCPLCGALVTEHDTFTLRARTESLDAPDADAA